MKTLSRTTLMLLLVALALGGCATAPKLNLKQGYALPAPAGGTTKVLGVLENAGDRPLAITGARSPQAARAQLVHIVSYESPDGSETEQPEPVDTLRLPPKSALELLPEGLYLTLEGLQQPLQPGGQVTIVLVLEGGKEVTFTVPVQSR